MVTLSGGVAQNANLSPMDVFLQQYGGNIAAASQGLPTFDLGVSYSAPIQQPVMPVYQPQPTPVMPVQTNTTNAPVNVQLSPVQQSSSNLQLAPINFPGLPGFTPEQAPGMIQIGGRQYPADSIIAQATQSFAPGVPQMDTMSDAAYGYQATAMPDTSNPQAVRMEAGQETLPDNFYGMPNPYMQRPQAPQYNDAVYDAAMNAPQQAINSLPQFSQYYTPDPGPALTANPLSWLQRGIYATSGQAAKRAAQYADAEKRYKEDADRIMAIHQSSLGPRIGLAKEVISQRGADNRLAATASNNAAQTMLEFFLDQREKQILSHAQSLDLASQAFLLPSQIGGQPNRQKALLLNRAGQSLGWSPQDVAALMGQQDLNAAEQFQQNAIKTQQDAFNLRKATQMLSGELSLLRAEVGKTNAEAGRLNAEANLAMSQADTNSFNLQQREKVAKYERWSLIAKAIEDVARATVARRTVNSSVRNAALQNEKMQADIFRQKMEANAVPVEAAARMSAAMATMSSSLDPTVKATAANLSDSVFGILGVQNKQVPIMEGNQVTGYKNMPVNAPPTVQQFQNQLRQMYPQQVAPTQAQQAPRYRRPAQPLAVPPQYYSGASLSGPPMGYQQPGRAD